MPSVSIAQQRLMAQAYEVRKFLDSKGKEGLDPKTLNKDYKDEIVDLANSMKKSELEAFAKTKHEGLPKRILKKESIEENSTTATLGSVNGMGGIALPGNPGSQTDFSTQSVGSGDIPNPKSKRRKKKSFRTFREFTDNQLLNKDLRTAF